jgi:hypothetical protein
LLQPASRLQFLHSKRAVEEATMSTSRWIRATAIVPLMLLTLSLATGAGVAAQNGCVLTVQPSSGAVGTRFAATGSGFGDPVVVTLFRNGAQVTERQLQPAGSTGRFTFRFTATGAGTWLVRAVTPETECGDEVRITVMADSATEATAATSGRESTGAAVVVVLAGALGFGVALRSTRRKRFRVRPT